MPDSGLVFNPAFRVATDAMATVSGGSIEFYAAGTTTPATVYSNSGLSTSLGSTVYLDSGGHPVASFGSSTKVLIYTGTALLKLVVKDADGVTLATYDNVKLAQVAGSGSGSAVWEVPISSSAVESYLVSETDYGRIKELSTSSSDVVAALPTALSAGNGTVVGFMRSGSSNSLSIIGSGSDTVAGSSSFALLNDGDSALFVCDGASDWKLFSFARQGLASGAITSNMLDRQIVGGLAAVGDIKMVAHGTVPAGWLECNGATVSRTTYASLFAVIGTTWGTGDGLTTFHLPDLRGRVPRFWDHGAARDPDAASRTASNTGGATGNNVGSVQGDALQLHTHVESVQTATSAGSGVNPVASTGTSASTQTASSGSVGTFSTETRMKNAYLMGIILADPAAAGGAFTGGAADNVTTDSLGTVDNRIMRVDGTTARKAQGSAATLDDSGNLSTPGYVDLTEQSIPGSPSANVARLYCFDDSGTTKLAFKDSGGTITVLGSGGGGGSYTAINSLTQDSSPDRAADFLRSHDTSAGSEKKVLIQDLPFVRAPVTGASTGGNVLTQATDQRVEIVKDSSALNYTGTRACWVVQFRDAASGTTNELIPAAVLQWNFTGNGDVTAASEASRTIWMGLQTSVVKSGDGSGHAHTVVGELGAIGPGGYNELGGYQGTLTNTGSNLGYMSGVEMLLQDRASPATASYSTSMYGLVGRVAKFNLTARESFCIVASSEGDKDVNAAFAVLQSGTQKFTYGLDLSYGTYSTGMTVLSKNNHALGWVRAGGSVTSVLLLNNADDTYLTSPSTVNITDNAFNPILKCVPAGSATGSVQVTASASAAPVIEAIGSASAVDLIVRAKSTGIVRIGTNGADEVNVSSTAIYPATDGGSALGTATNRFAGANLSDGIVTTAPGKTFSGIINAGLAVSAASNALTIALKGANGSDPSATNPVYIPFRSSTATTGTPVWRDVTAATSLVVSSGSTLGVTNATAFRLWVVAFDDGGTVRLGVINCMGASGVYPLRSDQIASSTAEGGAGAADSGQVFYTGTAVSSKAYTILGYIEWNTSGVTAGTWTTTNLAKVQMFGPGVALPGETVQTVIGTTSTTAVESAAAFTDSNLSVALTPMSSANRVKVDVWQTEVYNGGVSGIAVVLALYRGATQLMVASNALSFTGTGGGFIGAASLTWLDAPQSASSVTYKTQFKTSSSGNQVKCQNNNGTSVIIAQEIMA